MTEHISETLKWALRYHAADWPIFPCRNKEPYYEALETWGKSWQEAVESGQINEGIIRWWWERHPDAQIAVACGKRSGLTVIDIDWIKDLKTKKIFYDQGEKPSVLMTRWCKSMTSISGSDGRHVFCKYADMPNSTKTVHQQVDIRSQGGYVILPPSLHESGRRYEWDPLFPWSEDGLENLASFPKELMRSQMHATNSRERWKSIVQGTNRGSPIISTVALTGKLIRTFDEDTAWDLLRPWNALSNPTPMPEEQLLNTFLSILKLDYAKRPRGN